MPRLPAAELESAVLEQLRGILRAPALLGEVFDVCDRDAAFAMVDRAVARFGRVDGLVNNAQSFVSAKHLEDVTAR